MRSPDASFGYSTVANFDAGKWVHRGCSWEGVTYETSNNQYINELVSASPTTKINNNDAIYF